MDNLKMDLKGNFKFEVVLGADGPKTKAARFELFYIKGIKGKGIVVAIKPVTLEKSETPGVVYETYELFGATNVSMYVKMLARKSDKEVLAMAEKLDAQVPAIMSAWQTSGKTVATEMILAAAGVK